MPFGFFPSQLNNHRRFCWLNMTLIRKVRLGLQEIKTKANFPFLFFFNYSSPLSGPIGGFIPWASTSVGKSWVHLRGRQVVSEHYRDEEPRSSRKGTRASGKANGPLIHICFVLYNLQHAQIISCHWFFIPWLSNLFNLCTSWTSVSGTRTHSQARAHTLPCATHSVFYFIHLCSLKVPVTAV